ncbi:hypothetical protein [Jeotgalicoccus sp. WY2]|uniref:hypothetical protein n=1 Tax=Jeotgalicoccus sp. WY2 TaxID=2708346 RepID=UPI001BD5EC7B|nr:hypothetical protein [Jeotgalicoccus sp. WY2]
MDLTTKEHNLKFLNEGPELYAYIENQLEMTAADAEISEDSVFLKMSYNESFDIDTFVTVDTISGKEERFKTKMYRLVNLNQSFQSVYSLMNFQRKNLS